MLTEICDGVAGCLADGEAGHTWVRRYDGRGTDADVNQFLVILKPEIVATDGKPRTEALRRTVAALTSHDVHIGAVRALASEFVASERLIPRHYPRLWDVSRRGRRAMSAVSIERMRRWRPDTARDSSRVVGAHEFLERFADFTPYALEVLTRNLEVVKLGVGTYGMEMLVDDEKWIVVNGFHPQQLAHFTRPGGAIVVLECRSKRRMADIRRDTIGVTEPDLAVAGSIKHLLYTEQTDLGIGPICTRRNGVHISPGPLEGMACIRRYFSDSHAPIPLADTALGAALLRRGHRSEDIAALEDGPEVDVAGARGPLFEVTEDMNWDEALEFASALLDSDAS